MGVEAGAWAPSPSCTGCLHPTSPLELGLEPRRPDPQPPPALAALTLSARGLGCCKELEPQALGQHIEQAWAMPLSPPEVSPGRLVGRGGPGPPAAGQAAAGPLRRQRRAQVGRGDIGGCITQPRPQSGINENEPVPIVPLGVWS